MRQLRPQDPGVRTSIKRSVPCSSGTCRHPFCDGHRAGVAQGFVQGVGYAIAELVRGHDQGGMGADIAFAAGLTCADFKAAGVDPYDMKTLKKLQREEPRFPREKRTR